VGLSDKLNNFPHELSGGEKQRVAIARAMGNRPEVIIADEPTGNLDTYSSQEIMEIFQRLNREHNMTIMLVTHEQDIARHAKRIVTVRDGRIRQDLPVENRRDAGETLRQLSAGGEERQEEYEVLGNP
ncbi:MAG: ATP-binding cassette domain-containing protein, partial [Acidobacteria bacterium]|nr:ATP-binding cassette domain-containing protein [Acidobacteriota bacterium]